MFRSKLIRKVLSVVLMCSICIGMVFVVCPQNAYAIDQVELYSAKLVTDYSSIGTIQGYYIKGNISVQNLAYAKNVTIHYTYDGVTWQDNPASYVSTAPDGYEVWSFQTDYKSYVPQHQYDYYCRFAIKYEVNGQTYWDNNNGNDYFLRNSSINPSYPYVMSKSNVQLDSADRISNGTSLIGNIILKNLGNPKNVSIRYTTNNWVTYTDAAASFINLSQNGVETWGFNISNLPSGSTVKFAVAYSVNGTTYWDNNFGDNYTK